jgi:hypothetical protein
MPKAIKWLLGVLLLLFVLTLGYGIAGPYLAVNGIRNVVQHEQYDQLWRFVDFGQLRTHLRPQIHERIARGLMGRLPPSDNTSNIADVTALIAEPAIDAMVSPQGIASLLRGGALNKPTQDAPEANQAAVPADALESATLGFVSPSLFTATVENTHGQPVVFEFHRNGLSWKLAGLQLPDTP